MKRKIFFGGSFSPIIALIGNQLLAYASYFIARMAYLLENLPEFSEHLSLSTFMMWMRGGTLFDTTAICYTLSLYILLMLFPLAQKETQVYHKVCKWVFWVPVMLAFIVNLADSVYFPYTLRRTTTSVFREFDNENNLGGIFFTELASHWYFVLLTIAVGWLLWKLYLTPTTLKADYKTLRQRTVFSLKQLACLVVVVPLVVGGCRGGLESGVRPITVSNANQYVKSPKECAVVLNTPFALLRTIGKSKFQVPDYYASEAEMEAVFTPIHHPQPTKAFQRKNVVVLIVESFGREYIGSLNRWLDGGRYKGLTPHVDEIVKQSLVFDYSFCNGRKSIDGMPSVLCGIPMFVEPFVLTPASMNNYTSIAGLLAAEGYQTSFFHGANRGSMGFLAFANKVGFKTYFGRQDYAADSRFGGDKDFDGNWGIWDEPFLQYWATKLGEQKQPFMSACFTVSSHHPFVVPEKYKGVYKEGKVPIHKCIQYTDMAIGRFFDTARRQPWFENTIFVITSDHTNQSTHAEYQSDMGIFSSPIIIYDPSGEVAPGVSHSIAQQIDIVPTVLGILGYQKPYLSFGCDLTTTPEENTYAVNYLNGVYQYAKNGYVIQFDGHQTKAVYALNDRLMKRNLLGKVPAEKQMERELKAIIQQYMTRMTADRLMPSDSNNK